MKCFNCQEPGHFAADCPATFRAVDRDEHHARIAELVRRWVEGEIDVERKRIGISQENLSWYVEYCPRHLIYP